MVHKFVRIPLLFILLTVLALAGLVAQPALAAPVSQTSSTPTPQPEPEPLDIVGTAIAAGSFQTLVAAVSAAELVETLQGEGPFTVFAPTDDAFAALGSTVDALLADPKGDLTNILLYHVIVGAKVMSSDLVDGMQVEMANGSMATISLVNGAMIDGANIVTADIEASNGVIHVIDAVILPAADEMMAEETAMDDKSMEMATLTTNTPYRVNIRQGPALSYGIIAQAHSGESFSIVGKDASGEWWQIQVQDGTGWIYASLTQVHGDASSIPAHSSAMQADGPVTLSTNTHSRVNIRMGPGLSYAIIGKAYPQDVFSAIGKNDAGTWWNIALQDGNSGWIYASLTQVSGDAANITPMADIVGTAVAAGTFQTLVAAVSAAELVETLQGDGPFTVFAPTDDAFAALGSTVDALLADPKGALTNILLYHVIVGAKVMSSDLVDGMQVEMANGSMATISLANGAMIDGAKIVTADIEASNGVIHVIDAVIVPAE